MTIPSAIINSHQVTHIDQKPFTMTISSTIEHLFNDAKLCKYKYRNQSNPNIDHEHKQNQELSISKQITNRSIF